MQKTLTLALLAISAGLPSIAFSQDARSILETVQQKQLERWEGVDVYVISQSVLGNNTQTYFQRTEFQDKAGTTHTAFLPVASAMTGSGQCMGLQTMTPETWEAYAKGAQMTAGGATDGGLEKAGLPKGIFSTTGTGSTTSADPRFIESATLVGTETVDGRNAYHLRADNMGQIQEADGHEYKMDTINMWIDAKEYVPLRMKIAGSLTVDGEIKPMTIESTQADYRSVPGSSMYESFKQVMKISGMMDAEQEAQMAEAAQQMAELEKQMASMPAIQRKMMERMMGPKLEMMKSMSSGDGFQTEVTTRSILINPKMTGGDGQPCPTYGAQPVPAAAAPIEAPAVENVPQSDQDTQLTEMIQVSLVSLGYGTGSTGGRMTKRTAIAISRFQAANGMEVTGKPTPQLAGILSAALDAQD